MSNLYDVIIAGGGPVGLFLACELAMADVSVLVLEREPEPNSPSKVGLSGMRALNTASMDAFYRRGLLDKVTPPIKRPLNFQEKPGFQFAGQFAGIWLNANRLDLKRFKYRIPGPSLDISLNPVSIAGIEAVLAPRAESLGATILRGKNVTGVSQDEDAVTVEVGDEEFHAKWLVGCDGGRSTVRKAAGFEFVGTEPTFTGYAVQADIDQPDKLKIGFHPTEDGMYVMMRAGNFHLLDFDGGFFDRTQNVTAAHIQDVLGRVTGTDVKITKLHHASSFTDRCKQAARYRNGRVLLAGDAAHIHSPLGGQGLNLGLGDAVNLGWKLAATVRDSRTRYGPVVDLSLLDTYEQERRPFAAWVLEWTRTQVTVLKPGPHGAALRQLMSDLVDTDDGHNLFLGRIWGLSQRHDLGDAHPLVGASAPDFEFSDGSRLGPKLEGARGLLVDFSDGAALEKLAEGYKARVDYVGGVGARDQLGLSALLVRPDGIVAWVAEGSLDIEGAKAALMRWF
ncbi:FAD binding domain-containing protein [Daldinia vernicosa]|uniref:FAD binding domain-containing protein n=1 Tax=Daldinia vernicosa TaxID=114800 RepID=UPI002007EB7D|nr:FAD binding domain-containing protein [Daldinia vernicosa]KAI0851308.1 FAD binding domain-containing protein [Daldinia vernicosa]